ncbi:MAG TPA: class I SAM-dependent methyltransferase [Candidatus Binataceae bacterium]|jgi:SAM-dependent methyltransferase|nr:class I SAM-dependent methyltransferase [Candidatus Binataceae bacterium]
MEHQSTDPRVFTTRWYHRFEILPGVVTPGIVTFDAGAVLDSLGIPKDLSGKNAIDIGAWDGPMAFELERRGARVVALNVLDPNETAFNLAKELLGSQVEHVQGSVYDLTRLFKEPFDLVCFLGVYYHLTDPIQAFEQIARVLASEGQVCFEGECLRRYAETLSGDGVQDDLVRQIAISEIPLALCCPGEYKKSPNWFIPNFSCLSGWLKVAGMEIARHYFEESSDGEPPHQRIKGLATKRRPSVVITAVRQASRTLILSGGGFSARTVINFFCNQNGRLMNIGGLTPDGGVRLPIKADGPNQLRFDLPGTVEAGEVTIEACNPPYAGNERAIYRFEVLR